jgi:hypothetical protein
MELYGIRRNAHELSGNLMNSQEIQNSRIFRNSHEFSGILLNSQELSEILRKFWAVVMISQEFS